MNTAEVREAEHALQNLGWTELFAYLCPGAIMLLSATLWIKADFVAGFSKIAPHNEFISAILFLLLSYGIGLPVARAGEAAANRYLTARAKHHAFKHSSRWLKVGLRLSRLSWGVVAWIPEWPRTPYFVRQSLRLQEDIQNLGLPGLSITVNRWANLSIYRILVGERLTQPAALVLREAETVHRRCLFAIGVANAMMLVAFQAFLRILLQLWLPAKAATALFGVSPTFSNIGLTVVVAVTTVLSLTLRYVAGRFWEIEFLLTCSNPLNPRTNVGDRQIPDLPWRSILKTAIGVLRRS
ncbi:MAG TPA: hypothetical protein VHU83_03800 [Bryobacteraceae bacterium]|jgi:hypothetical protein|nr:hypothetical protein [Bryobacteraceae bacterium]